MDILQSFAQIGFDWRMAFANLINFLIVFVVLKYFVFQPIKRILTERKEKIQQGLEDAKKAKRDKVMAKEKYEKKINQAKTEANSILADAKEEKQEIMKEAREEARKEADRIKAEAREQIETEREQMQAQLREHTAELVIDSVEKILQKNVDEQTDREVIESMINQVNTR
jgi:F-type H+-transporting ATPase subunit b